MNGLFQGEALPHTDPQATAVAELYAQNDLLADPITRRDYFANLEPEDFIDLLQQTSSVIRTGDSNHLQPFDGANVMLASYEVPEQADKAELLKETWSTARQVLRDTSLTDTEALDRAGLISATGILCGHAYIDGNGRLSRVMSHMIMRGQTETTEAELEQLLGEDGRTAWQVMPSGVAMGNYASAYEPPHREAVKWPHDIQWRTDGDGPRRMGERGYGREADPVDQLLSSQSKARVLHQLMAHLDSAGMAVLDRHTVFSAEGEAESMVVETALRDLVNVPDKGIGYAAQISEAVKWGRKEQVQRYLRALVETEATEPDYSLTRELDYIARQEKLTPRQAELVRAFGALATADGRITPMNHMIANHISGSLALYGETTLNTADLSN